jgi:hypothetical protein
MSYRGKDGKVIFCTYCDNTAIAVIPMEDGRICLCQSCHDAFESGQELHEVSIDLLCNADEVTDDGFD